MSKRVLFDVGANNGDQWIDELRRDQENTFVYMFEPTPYLCNVIKEKYSELKNWCLVEKAVSDFEGQATFNIQGLDNWGCSSLLEFREDISETYPKASLWALRFTDSIQVDVTTLNAFLRSNPEINHIDYLHIDAQGSDLRVIQGCSDFLHYVKAGRLEASYNAPLYEGSPTHIECTQWLHSHNFTTRIDYIDRAEECDVFFEKQ